MNNLKKTHLPYLLTENKTRNVAYSFMILNHSGDISYCTESELGRKKYQEKIHQLWLIGQNLI